MAEDWLPHPPPPPPAKKSTAGKTILIWLVLVVMFIAIYNLAATPSSPRETTAATGYSGWWIWAAAAIGFALPIILVVWQFRGGNRFNAQMAPGLEALAEGSYGRAAEVFAGTTRSYAHKLNYRVHAAYSHGYALIRSGDAAAGVGILLGADRTPTVGVSGIKRLAAIELTRGFAIGGDLSRAERWLEAARERAPAMGDPGPSLARYEAVHALYLCRRGDHAEALALFAKVWHRLETYLPVTEMREPWLLRAFAIASTSGPRDGGAADTWVRFLRGTPASRLTWLTAHWPELAHFTATHGLASVDRSEPAAATAPAS